MTQQPGSDPATTSTTSPSGAKGSAAAAGKPRPQLPPDPEAYDSPRAELARARGLDAPYIAGGRDPDPDKGRREERFYGRLLLAMVLVIALGAFVLGFLIDLAGNLGH